MVIVKESNKDKIVNFKIPNEWSNVLYKILKPINIEKYIWQINDSESYREYNGVYKPLFIKDLYNGKEFLKIINDEYYIIHCKILGRNIEQKEINFKIIIDDSVFAKIFVNNMLFEILIKNLMEQGFDNIKIK